MRINNLINVTYLAYTGMDESLGKSQVLPYVNLIDKFTDVHLISFEKKELDDYEKSKIISDFSSNQIRWTNKRYHKSPRMMATIFDIITMIYLLVKDRHKGKIHYVHCRGYVTSIAALVYSIFFKKVRYIFDMRAFWLDEMVSAKMLKRTSLLYFLLKKVEKILILKSYSIIVLTDAARKYLVEKEEFNYNKFYTIPTCVDHLKFHEIVKKKNLINADSLVIGTIGTISSGWFLTKKFSFFLSSLKKINPKLILRIVTQDNPEDLLVELNCHGISEQDVQIYSANSEDMPNEISQFDVIVMFFISNFSKLGSAPTRFGEALASGVPCVVNSGVGDLDKIVYENNIGVVVSDFSEIAVKKSCDEVLNLLRDDSLKIRCIEASKKYFSLDIAETSYKELYGALE